MTDKPPARVELLQGTLDVLILRTLLGEPKHGHAIRSRAITDRLQPGITDRLGSRIVCLIPSSQQRWMPPRPLQKPLQVKQPTL